MLEHSLVSGSFASRSAFVSADVYHFVRSPSSMLNCNFGSDDITPIHAQTKSTNPLPLLTLLAKLRVNEAKAHYRHPRRHCKLQRLASRKLAGKMPEIVSFEAVDISSISIRTASPRSFVCCSRSLGICSYQRRMLSH